PSFHSLKIHIRVHRPKGTRPFTKSHPRERQYVCIQCEKKFQSLFNLTVHERIHTSERPYECVTCKKSFAQLRGLRFHERTHAGKCQCELRVEISSCKTAANECEERQYACTECKETFHTPSQLSEHNKHDDQMNEVNDSLYKCVDCVKLFKRRRHVLKHRLEAHNSTSVQYGCGLCGEMFSTNSNAIYCFYRHILFVKLYQI